MILAMKRPTVVERLLGDSTKAVTYNERLKMKRDAQQKSSPFLRKRLLFCQASLFIFGCLSYVTGLTGEEWTNFSL